MEWNQLHTFLVAAVEENFSRAAELLHTSQPSLSQTIKRLEEDLGYSLFEREGKHIRLNESGKIWMHTVQQMEELYDNTKVRLEEMHGKSHPQVSIYLGCASTLLIGLLQFLRERNPGVQYQIHQWNVTGESKDKDIQILAELPETGGSKETVSVLFEESVVLAVPANHRLLSLEEITLKDLEKEEFISLNNNWAHTRCIARETKRMRFTPRVTMWVDNPNLMRELLKEHMGIAFVPALSWRSFAGEEVVMRPVKGCNMNRYVYLKTPERTYLTREQKECIKGIKEFFAGLSL